LAVKAKRRKKEVKKKIFYFKEKGLHIFILNKLRGKRKTQKIFSTNISFPELF